MVKALFFMLLGACALAVGLGVKFLWVGVTVAWWWLLVAGGGGLLVGAAVTFLAINGMISNSIGRAFGWR